MTYIWTAILLIFTVFSIRAFLTIAKRDGLPSRKKVSFIFGMLLLLIAQSEPVLHWGDSLFFVHMLQQTFTFFIVPILLLLAMTDKLLQPVYNDPRWKNVFQVVTQPVFALVVFNGLFCLLYMPFVFDVVMSSFLWRIPVMVLMFVLAFFLWWPAVSPAENKTTLQPFIKIIYVIGIGVFLTPLGIYIIFGGDVLYNAYSAAPEIGEMTALRAQQVGGVAWKVITVAVYCILIAAFIQEAETLDRQRED